MAVALKEINSRVMDALILGLVSFASARIAVSFLITPEGMAPFWFANGVVVAMLLRRPLHHWPLLLSVVFAAFLFNMLLVGGFPLAPNIAYGVANVAEPMIAALAIRRFEPNFELSRLRALGVLLLCAAFACSIGATIAWLAGPVNWALWMVDDLLGMVLFAPAILAFWTFEKQAWRRPPVRDLIEMVVLAVSMTLVIAVIFTSVKGPLGLYLTYLMIPFLLWATLRFQIKGSVLASLLLGTLTIGFTLYGIGPFAALSAQLIDSSLAIQAFVATVMLSHLSLGVVLVERERSEATIKSNEARFKQLVETTHEGVWTIDTEGQTTYVNPRMAMMLGYSAREMLGIRTSKIIHDEDRAIAFRQSDEGQSVASKQQEIRLNCKNGAERWVIMTTSPIRGNDGVITGSLSMVTDITERKAIEAQMVHAQRLESLGTLAGGIAHDFNNILTGIVGNVGLVTQMLPADHKAQNLLVTVREASTRATELVRQILTFSRHGDPQRNVIAVAKVVKETVKLLTAAVPAMIKIDTSFDPRPCDILADPSQIHQIIMNLGTNAVHAMRSKGNRLSIALEPIYLTHTVVGVGSEIEPGQYVRLSISDEGEGLDDAMMKRIFDPYFSTKGPGEGTGLGLSVVLGIVRGHGGALTVSSTKGKGTTFNVFFPAVYRDDAKQEAPEVKPVMRGHGERVLYVDDEKTITQFITSFLTGLGYAAHGVSDAQRALALFEANPDNFDAIITDHAMPGLSGIELARRAKTIKPGIPTVLVSGFMSPDATDEATRLGIRYLLSKPDFIGELPSTLGKIFGN